MMKLIAGNKLIVIAACVLVVGLISAYAIQFIRSAEKDKITIELQDHTNEKRKVIRDAIKTPRGSTGNDASDSLQYLRERQGD